jgi:glucose-1-phosphate thymidylyltransferase
MKAIITAGGRGTRLRPLTHTKNKHLLPIANEPIIFRAIDDVVNVGIKEVLININKGDTEVPEMVGDGSKWNIQISYQEQDEPRGLGHLLKLSEEFVAGEDFVFYYGDNVFTGGLEEHISKWKESGTNFHLCLVKVNDPERFGIAVVDGDRIIKTVEKPQQFISDLAITGIQLYDKNIFEALNHIKPTPPAAGRTIAEMDIPPANQWMIDNDFSASYSIIDGWWKDTGKPETLLDANRLVLEAQKEKIEGEVEETQIEGNVVIHPTAKVKFSKITGPVIIGENTIIENSEIGPNVSIYNDCEIKGSIIENSLILGNVKIHNLKSKLENSLLGWDVTVKEKEETPKSTSLFVGDNSIVEI